MHLFLNCVFQSACLFWESPMLMYHWHFVSGLTTTFHFLILIDGNLGCFWILAIINNAALILVCKPLSEYMPFYFSWINKYLTVRIYVEFPSLTYFGDWPWTPYISVLNARIPGIHHHSVCHRLEVYFVFAFCFLVLLFSVCVACSVLCSHVGWLTSAQNSSSRGFSDICRHLYSYAQTHRDIQISNRIKTKVKSKKICALLRELPNYFPRLSPQSICLPAMYQFFSILAKT